MRAPKWLSRMYQTNSRVHLALAPIRHGLVALRNLARPGDLHQAWSTTRLSRRPKLMKALSEIVPDEGRAKVLSFGCSTGEEVLDIRQYYRQAKVFGTDLNRKSLKKGEASSGISVGFFTGPNRRRPFIRFRRRSGKARQSGRFAHQTRSWRACSAAS